MSSALRDRVLFGAALLLAAAFALAKSGAPSASVPSTFDTGPHGYAALYEFLAREGTSVSRLGLPISERTLPTGGLVVAGAPAIAQAAPERRVLRRWLQHGGVLFILGRPPKALRRAIAGRLRGRAVIVANAQRFDNAHLAQKRNAAAAYATLGSVRRVTFDERPYGDDAEASLWSVLPMPIRAAIAIAVLALALAVVGENLPFAPRVPARSDAVRDSGAYLDALAALLAGARAAPEAARALLDAAEPRLRRAAARNPSAASDLLELERLRARTQFGSAELAAAGRIFTAARKGRG